MEGSKKAGEVTKNTGWGDIKDIEITAQQIAEMKREQFKIAAARDL